MINQYAQPIFSVKDLCPVECTYKAVMHGQEVTITRYKPLVPKERQCNPCFPVRKMLHDSIMETMISISRGNPS